MFINLTNKRIAKYKTRLVARGDQQAKSMIGGTYATALAARYFEFSWQLLPDLTSSHFHVNDAQAV
jgi:hypothetical protein